MESARRVCITVPFDRRHRRLMFYRIKFIEIVKFRGMLLQKHLFRSHYMQKPGICQADAAVKTAQNSKTAKTVGFGSLI